MVHGTNKRNYCKKLFIRRRIPEKVAVVSFVFWVGIFPNSLVQQIANCEYTVATGYFTRSLSVSPSLPPSLSLSLSLSLYIYIYTYIYIYKGLFIIPSGISELDFATTKTDTAERSISTERHTLQVSVLPYRCSIYAPLVSVLVVAQSSSEIPEGLMNNPVYCAGDKIEKNEMGWACGAYGWEEGGCLGSWWGNRWEGDHWGDLGVDGWILLGRISRRWDVGIWTGFGWPRIETVGRRLWVR